MFKQMWRCLAALALMGAGLAAPVHGETLLVLVEEYRNGEALEVPLASQEGLMSAMFDLGHVTFETGQYRPSMDWDTLEFAEPLRLAREGRGAYLAAVRVFAELQPAEREALFGAGAVPAEGIRVSVQAQYLLFDAETSRLTARGELTGSSSQEERELTYDQFLFAIGERLARSIVSRIPHPELLP
ncbi:MAG: hypothetical protein JW820_11290 [Spirochaetales bacterium]|nr:hypothetical protein [Spirochaetales bacterium]